MIRTGTYPWQRCVAAVLAAFLFLVCFLSVSLRPVSAEEASPVLRVAFPPAKGLTETAADGTRYGLVVDYLNEIAKYTGWKYEFIDTTGETMLQEFAEGKYDLMGGAYYAAGFEELFAYPDYNTGHSRSVLLARREDTSIKSYDAKDLNGKVIGVYANAKENIRRLEAFLKLNGVEYTLKRYTSDQLVDGNLYGHLADGEVDLLLGNSTELPEGCRVVTSFESQPLYMVTTVGNQEVLDGLNMALEKIVDSNPKFAEERYAANFPFSSISNVFLNGEERAYIDQKKTVTVAIPASYHPFFCIREDESVHDGIVPDVLKEITAFSGLQFTYRYTDSYTEALRLVQEGQADMMGFFLGTEAAAAEKDLSLTQSYVTMNDIVVRNKAVSYPSKELVCAVLDGRQLPEEIEVAETRSYHNITDALLAVNRGEVDCVFGLSARLEQDIQQRYLTNVVPVTLFNNSIDVSFALARPAEPALLTILNKAIGSLSAEEKTVIANRNMISVGTGHVSMVNLIYANPVMFVTGISCLLLLLVAVILVVTRMRLRAVTMRSELAKAEAESKAKSVFLSRMSHEIRTPMNAVIGLADLTSMMEDVPEAVQQNLAKIRSSSHYLLSLINDILDMSRIDSRMLTIANEPFSLTRMLGDLRSMMAAEADRRGLTLAVQVGVQHEVLTGDAIRLQQVLTNLLSNALKFTPAGGHVELIVSETKADDAGATLTFHVMDNGIGILPEDRERIFHSFEQAGTSISRSQGTGLGLPISSSIVHLMGGDLQLESEPGEGSDFFFTLTLPLGTLPEEAKAPETDLLAGAQLLLAEDNALNAEIAVQLLEMQGAIICLAENGRQAVDLFADSSPGYYHAVLLDIQMPEMDGLEAARTIRAMKRPDAAAVPIIAMTANSFQEDIDAAAAAGMNAFVTKPLDANYLFGVLRELLEKSGRKEDSDCGDGHSG